VTKSPKSFKKLAFVASQKPSAKNALERLTSLYGNCDPAEANAIVALGGDGFMLETLRRNITLIRRGLPVYGMNKGTIGFLMNEYDEEALIERVSKAEATTVRPLKMTASGAGGTYEELAFNEVSLYRQSQQAAHIQIKVDGKVRLERLISDGVLLATPAGSTLAAGAEPYSMLMPMSNSISWMVKNAPWQLRLTIKKYAILRMSKFSKIMRRHSRSYLTQLMVWTKRYCANNSPLNRRAYSFTSEKPSSISKNQSCSDSGRSKGRVKTRSTISS